MTQDGTRTHTQAASPTSTGTRALPVFVHTGRFRGHRYIAPHSHTGDELVLVVEGRCAIGLGGIRLEGRTGTLFVLPREHAHEQRNHVDTVTWYLTCMSNPALLDNRPRTIDIGLDSWPARWLDELNLLRELPVPPPRETLEGILFALLHSLRAQEAHTGIRQALNPIVRRSLSRIEQDPAAELSVNSLAYETCVSPGYLLTLFKREFGMGPMAYAKELRMRKACRLLTAPYASIKEVAAACGYDDPNYFARAFRKARGYTPSEWRRGTGRRGKLLDIDQR